MRHEFKPAGGMASNPGVWDNTHGGLIYVDACVCGTVRKRGVDYTGVRPGNNWGPEFSDAKGNRLPKAGECQREI